MVALWPMLKVVNDSSLLLSVKRSEDGLLSKVVNPAEALTSPELQSIPNGLREIPSRIVVAPEGGTPSHNHRLILVPLKKGKVSGTSVELKGVSPAAILLEKHGTNARAEPDFGALVYPKVEANRAQGVLGNVPWVDTRGNAAGSAADAVNDATLGLGSRQGHDSGEHGEGTHDSLQVNMNIESRIRREFWIHHL